MKRIALCLPLIIPVCALVLTLMAGCGHKNATSHDEAPFSPVCQSGDRLITAITTDDTPSAVLPGLSIQAQIIFHRTK